MKSNNQPQDMKHKEVCIECGEEIKTIGVLPDCDFPFTGDSKFIQVCYYPKCLRYGLLTTVTRIL